MSKLQSGFTLVELLVALTILVIISAAANRLIGDYFLVAKNIRLIQEGNTELVNLLRDIQRSFQSATSRGSKHRACILFKTSPDADGTNLSDFSCYPNQGEKQVVADGIGFSIDESGSPGIAYINACEKIPSKMVYPSGRGGPMNVAPRNPGELDGWGGMKDICPAKCPDGSRPVVRHFSTLSGSGDFTQIPKKISSASDYSALTFWGAVICGQYFQDSLMRMQGIFGDNVGAFDPDYLTFSVFLARARFDFKAKEPVATEGGVSTKSSSFVWMHGGALLEFSQSQEMLNFKCRDGMNVC